MSDEREMLKQFKEWMDFYSPEWQKAFTPGEVEPMRACWFAATRTAVAGSEPPSIPTPEMLKEGGAWWVATLHNAHSSEFNASVVWAAMLDAWRNPSACTAALDSEGEKK